MGIKLTQLLNDRRTITVNTAAGDIKLTYAPNAITPQMQAKLADAGRSIDAQLDVMEKVFADWDVEGPLENLDTGEIVVPDGEPIPLTAEMLRLLPVAITGAMFQAAAEDLIPKSRTTSTNSRTPTSDTWT